jgi:hypothetical protein
MWQSAYNLFVGLMILPAGLMLTGSGGAGLWYVLTQARSRLQRAVLVLSPIEAAAGIYLIYQGYDHLLSVFGVHLASLL